MTTPGAGAPPPETPPGETTDPDRDPLGGLVPPTAPTDPSRPGSPSSATSGTASTGTRERHTRPNPISATQGLSGNWPVQAADAIVAGVDTVRDKTTGPVQTAARGLVYGILVAVVGTMVAVLLLIGLIRATDALLGALGMDPPRIWLTYLILGAVFLLAGALIFRRRRPVEPS